MTRRVILIAFKHLITPSSERVFARKNVTLLTSSRRGFCCGRETSSDNQPPAHGAKFELTVSEVMKTWTRAFRKQEVPEPEESIRNIIACVLNIKKLSDVERLKHKCLSAEDMKKLETLCKRRLERMPIQYIIGEWDFRDLNLKMRPPVFIPRPETEMLVDLVIEEIRLKKAKKVLELCCGSGAISLALLNEFADLKVTAIDRSTDACNLTKENAQMLHLNQRLSVHQYEINGEDKMDFLGDKFDLVVSNPPYVPSADLNELQPEIKLHEDLRALDGGEDGLNIIRHILKVSSNVLCNGSKLFLEVDPSHPARLNAILSRQCYPTLRYLRTHTDFCGKDRFVEIIKSEN